MDSKKTIEAEIGLERFNKLKNSSKHPTYLDKIADMICSYYARNPDFNLKNNLLIGLIKGAIQSHQYHPAQVTGNAHILIRDLDLDEPMRIKLYEALFDKDGIHSQSIQIHR